MQEKYEIICEYFHGYDYRKFFTASPREKMSIIPEAMDYILKRDDNRNKFKDKFVKHVTELSLAYSLVSNENSIGIRDEVAFFQVVKAGFVKITPPSGKTQEDYDSAIRQIISRAIAPGEVIDIFETVGLKKPDISIISEEFLADVRKLPHKNLALELLKRLLNDEIRSRQKKNIIQGRSFAEMLDKAIKRYQNKSIETVQVIEELIELARKMREARDRGQKLNLSENELAFYDALEVNDSAVQVLGDEVLREIAQELTKTIRNNVSIDWTLKENVQAKLRVMVKRVLKKYGYPPDKQKKATELILKQAELICKDVVGE